MDKLKSAIVGALMIGTASNAFADTVNPDNPYAYIPEELAELLNQLPPEIAMETYNHLTEYTQCIEKGGAVDAGSTAMNMMNIMVEYSLNQLNDFVNSPDEFETIPMPSYEGAVVCASQYEAWGLLNGGRLANAFCDETGQRILNFSRPLDADIGLPARQAAPTCNAL